MSLRELQLSIAALACEDGQLEALARDPDAWLRARGLHEKEARLLRGIDPTQMRRFRDIHARDRASVLAALFQHTTKHARPGTLEAYARSHPYGNDDDLVEINAFVAFVHRTHPGHGLRDIAARDLVAYESSWWRVARAPPFRPHAPPAALPHADASAASARGLQLSEGLAAFLVQADIRPLVDEDAPSHSLKARRGVVLLRRDDDGITSAWIDGAPAQVITDALHGWTADEVRHKRGPEGARALHELLEEGILQ